MNKTLSLALLIVGIILLIAGVAASDSAASGISRFFTGNPTDKTMWLMIGGIAAVVVGGGGLLGGRRS
jgi:LPXTG-motif cell wall-anchored protein